MADHPYRADLVTVDPAPLAVAETERAPRGVYVRAWSDGTTHITLRLPLLGVRVACLVGATSAALATLALPLPYAVVTVPLGILMFALALAPGGLPRDRELTRVGEEIVVTSEALIRRGTLETGDVYALADIISVVVDGSGNEARVELECGRDRIQLAGKLGFDEKALRWIAQRLRRAIDEARADKVRPTPSSGS